ncbi:MAG TPA: MlaD family protein [Burkholderiaceae bacterium]|jgi:phospholipid/cholesterol/gamma-HCH transport system substrate-binding protein|nr:MlaD family protein [Burkholderiaceae bacterium]
MVSNPSTAAPPVAYLEFKVAALFVLMLLLVGGTVLYVMYARGVFEPTQQLVLLADDSEGVKVGMDLTFSGFPIGRVRRIELDADGSARIVVDVPRKDAHWLRQSSVFTLVRGMLGNTSIRAYSGILTDPPLADGEVRKVLVGDATAEIPHLVSAAHDLIQNLTALTGPGSPLSASLANLQETTARFKGQHGALGVLLGNDKDAGKLVAALDRTNALLARIDGIAAHADVQVFGADGAVSQSRAAIAQLDAALGDARETLKKVDAVLQEAQGVASNVRVATTDLGALRAEVEVSLRKVEYLVDEVNRKWPFARDTELKLP